MSMIETLLSDIEQAVRGSGERQRDALLRRTVATLTDHLGDLSDHDLAIFDDVMVSLVQDSDAGTRVELSECLADLSRVPKKTVRVLALDDILQVAKPLIDRSPCLDEETLVTIICEKDERFLQLISRRRALPTRVIDHLIERSDDALVTELARNETTPISDTALRLLAERALTHQPLYRVLRTRPDLATRHIGAVIEAARYRTKLDEIDDSTNDDMLSRALAVETARIIAETPNLSLSTRIATREPDDLNHQNIHDLLERAQIDDALIILAAETGITHDVIKQAFHASQHEPLLFLLRAQDYPLAIVMNFMRHKHGTLSDEFETQISDAYCTLARDTAKRIAAFMREKHSVNEVEMSEPLRQSA